MCPCFCSAMATAPSGVSGLLAARQPGGNQTSASGRRPGGLGRRLLRVVVLQDPGERALRVEQAVVDPLRGLVPLQTVAVGRFLVLADPVRAGVIDDDVAILEILVEGVVRAADARDALDDVLPVEPVRDVT